MKKRSWRYWVTFIGWILIFGIHEQEGFGAPDAAPERAGSDLPDVVLISLDTTRADHLSLYGYPLPTSPNLDRLGGSAVVFEKARAVVPLTGPSHASVFTSLYPHQHGSFRNGIPVRRDVATLAGLLADRGYDTAAFLSGWTLKRKICGLDRGFRVYDEAFTERYKFINRERPAEEVTRAVGDFLSSGAYRRPLFLFVHYFDPHDPYRRHPGHWKSLTEEARRLGTKVPEKVLEYDTEVAYMDHHLGELLERLKGHGLLANAIVWIVGDHGESLGEHGYWGHGRRVYEQILHVPMVLHAPGRVAGPARVAETVSTLDVLPTLLGLLGLSAPAGHAMEGQDLSASLINRTPLTPRRQYFETFKGTLRRFTRIVAKEVPDNPSFLGYYENNMKYIIDGNGQHMEIYDLSSDPSETRNLASEKGSSFSPAELLSWFQQGRSLQPVAVDLSKDDVDQLRSLGYLQ